MEFINKTFNYEDFIIDYIYKIIHKQIVRKAEV